MSETPESRLAAARARMAELAVKFIERTRGEIESLRARLSAFGAGDMAALADLRNLAHRICGTGATLGFDTLAERAHRLEKIAAEQEGGAGLDQDVLSGLAAAIDSLAAELDQIARAGDYNQ